MALHKAPDGSIHDDMDGAALSLLPAGCIPITDEDATALNPRPVPPNPRIAELKAQILALDQKRSGLWLKVTRNTSPR